MLERHSITLAKTQLEQGPFLSTNSWLAKYTVEALNLKQNPEPFQQIQSQLTRNTKLESSTELEIILLA